MKIIVVAIVLILFQSCLPEQKKALVKGYPYVMPDLPYMALNKKELDTTFDYEILERTIYATLPKNIFSGKVTGTVEFYSMITKDKHVEDIKLITGKFHKKGKIIYEYKPDENDLISIKLKKYILGFIQDKPFRQTKPATLKYHPTYCYIKFIWFAAKQPDDGK